MLEDFQSHLEKEEDRRDNAEEKLQRSSKILVSVKAGVDHLADKLHHLKAVSLAVWFLKNNDLYELHHRKMDNFGFDTSEGSAPSGHQPCLIRVFAVVHVYRKVLSYTLCAQ